MYSIIDFFVNKIFLIRLLSLFSKEKGSCFPGCNGINLKLGVQKNIMAG